MTLTRIGSVLAAATLAAVILVAPADGRDAGSRQGAVMASPSIEQPLLALINHVRHDHGLRPLRVAEGLVRAARAHARSMARGSYFGHSSPDGTSAPSRIRRFYRGSAVGETILWGSPDVGPGQALRMWIGSSAHRAILLSKGFSEIGLAAVHVAPAGGFFGGRPVTIVVADFGSR